MEVQMESMRDERTSGLGLIDEAARDAAAQPAALEPPITATMILERASLERTMLERDATNSFCQSTGYQDCLRRRAEKAERESIVQRYREGVRENRPTCKARLQHFVSSGAWFALLGTVIILEWLYTWFTGDEADLAEKLFATAVSCAFLLDVWIRLHIFTPTVFFRKLWNIIDAAIALLTLAMTILLLCGVTVKRRGRNIMWSVQLVRIVRLFRVTALVRRSCPAFRRITGENKRRYVDLEQDFDLDLTYITPRLIGMSVPAGGTMTFLYRNPRNEVVRFFETFYPHHYLIVNMCPEHPYRASAFASGMVELFDVEDHTPPCMWEILKFLEVAEAWRLADPERNIMAIHCRGGKGRTGSFCCAWLMYVQEAEDAQDSLNFFAMRRTDMDGATGKKKVQGVETRSQVRYIEYVDCLLRTQGSYSPHPVQPPPIVRLQLLELRLQDVLRPEAGTHELAVMVYDRVQKKTLTVVGLSGWHTFNLAPVIVENDFILELYARGSLNSEVSLVDFCWNDRGTVRGAGPLERPLRLLTLHLHSSFLVGEQLEVETACTDRGKGTKRLLRDSGSLRLSFKAL